ncbi:hypothetical protein MMC25_006836 [Agyrium rufum]|nr:hypothetical protein [Agyrium rufum]
MVSAPSSSSFSFSSSPPSLVLPVPPTSPKNGLRERCLQSVELFTLPDELLLHVLSFLDLPDLLALSRTHSRLRSLALDPILHRQRLHLASIYLSFSLPHRPPLSAIRPPSAAIYLTPTLVAARKISRSLISIRLQRRLGNRPSVGRLVETNILPEECFQRSLDNSRRKGRRSSPTFERTAPAGVSYCGEGLRVSAVSNRSGRKTVQDNVAANGGYTYVSPRLVGMKRGLEKERVKDSLRGWLMGKRKREAERREREEEGSHDGERRSVDALVRKYSFTTDRAGTPISPISSDIVGAGRGSNAKGSDWRASESRWGAGAVVREMRRRGEPTRAHVLGLRRFWESVGRGGGQSCAMVR